MKRSHTDKVVEQLETEIKHVLETEVRPRQIAIEKLRAQAVKAKAARSPRRKPQLVGSEIAKSAS